MKKSLIYIIIFLTLILSQKLQSQDFNLFNPSNEMYLFSAYDEGANAFRYNPAILGLGHKMNGAVNLFLNKIDKKLALNEYDILLNSGVLGLSYRFAEYERFKNLTGNQIEEYNKTLSTFSLGLGFGNKTFSTGLIFEFLQGENIKSLAMFGAEHPRIRGGIGFLYRPTNFISAALTVKTKEGLTNNGPVSLFKFTGGLAFKPLGNDFLNAMIDFGFLTFNSTGFFEHHMLKVGANVQPVKGLYLNANFTRINDYTIRDYFNIGFTYELPNSSVKYTNTMYKFTDRDNSPSSYKNIGTQLSFAFNFEKKPSIVKEKQRVLEISLSGSLQDYHTEDVFFGIIGTGKRSVHEVIADIDNAAIDNSVSGLLIKIYPLSTGLVEVNAQVEELAAAIERFKARGKTVTAYFPQDVGPAEYYLATYANKIVMPDESMMFYGLSMEVLNYKQFLAKYGIELQTFYAGKYKLTFQGLLDSSTAEGKEVINRVLDILYDKMLKRITTARNIAADDYIKTKLSQPISGIEAKRLALVDANGWYNDAKELTEKNSKTNFTTDRYNRSIWDKGWGEPDEIAIIGVYSSITSGESEAPSPIKLPIPFVGSGRSTGSETVIRQLEDAFANPKVKAIIFRVDSGGGSALASAEINAAIIRLKKKYKKPFYVSMGGAAASGGYYVSANADKIFADDLTVTGSIGVFYAKPNLDSLMKSQKIKVEIFKRGENSDMASIFKGVDEKEVEIIQGMVDYYYDRFIQTVSEGRKMTRDEVEQVAQGRVWLGTDAFNKKLVDEIGGLYDVISYAKKENRIDSRFKITYYAVPGGNSINEIITTSVLTYFEKSMLDLLGFGEEDNGVEIK
ncbi:MAG: signal peptide peptidase SppA [Ignavibacteriae bacterium]|nr:MAG: signal peptide peptidase SppA [Ignavibacteriota bacterium]